MENNKLTFIDEKGNEVLCEILFTVHSDEFGKDYVLFYPIGQEDEEGNVDIMAASYLETSDGEGELEEVTTEEEWKFLEEMLESFEQDEEEEDEDEE